MKTYSADSLGIDLVHAILDVAFYLKEQIHNDVKAGELNDREVKILFDLHARKIRSPKNWSIHTFDSITDEELKAAHRAMVLFGRFLSAEKLREWWLPRNILEGLGT